MLNHEEGKPHYNLHRESSLAACHTTAKINVSLGQQSNSLSTYRNRLLWNRNFPNAFQKCWTTTTPRLSLTLAAASYQKIVCHLCIRGDRSLQITTPTGGRKYRRRSHLNRGAKFSLRLPCKPSIYRNCFLPAPANQNLGHHC